MGRVQDQGGNGDASGSVAELFTGLLGATHTSAPGDIAALVAEHARAIGAEDVVVWLVDHGAEQLAALTSAGVPEREPIPVEGTVAGRCFATTSIIQGGPGAARGCRRLWLPLLDGTDRLGVLEMTVPVQGSTVDDRLVLVCERLAHLVAQIIATKAPYGDAIELVRRRRPMTLAAEVQRSLAPPPAFAGQEVVLAAISAPSYEVGGDTFDYAVNPGRLHVGLLDGMGHGLGAALVAALAVSA